MSESQLFQSARLKIKRAYEHIDEANTAINALSQGDVHDLRIEPYRDTPYDLLKIVPHPLPDCIPLAIGDAVHNLRSALDHVVWETIFRITNTIPEEDPKSNFPIKRTAKEVETAIKNGCIQRTTPDIIALILDELKPDQRTNIPLWSLHRLDLADKHRLLVPVLHFAYVQSPSLINERGEVLPFPMRFEIMADGPIAGLPVQKGLKVHHKGQATVKILFNDGDTFRRAPVVPTLHQIAQTVSHIVDQFTEKLFPIDTGAGHTPPHRASTASGSASNVV